MIYVHMVRANMTCEVRLNRINTSCLDRGNHSKYIFVLNPRPSWKAVKIHTSWSFTIHRCSQFRRWVIILIYAFGHDLLTTISIVETLFKMFCTVQSRISQKFVEMFFLYYMHNYVLYRFKSSTTQ